MEDYIFGANILENLTTGMYQDSKVAYREYIQNACDQIDSAEKQGLLKKGEGEIDIWLDEDKRTISVEDNATGIKSSDFRRVLGNIADSDKILGDNKGFRGIGRLCGLAYCEKLTFTSKVKGENIISKMVCDAKKMRAMLDQNLQGEKHSANDVLNAINVFETEQTDDIDTHFFKVELININDANTELLDFQTVKDYLSFVAPVAYDTPFLFSGKIHDHVNELNQKIDEYSIKLKGESVFKRYVTILKDKNNNKYDDIFDIELYDFLDTNNNMLAWMWVGLSQLKNAIPPRNNPMRGIRLRKDNIQIGDEDTLQKLFKEDRGNSYFIGEVYAVSKDLIPNSQRNYFNENPVRNEFELQLRQCFDEKLKSAYYTGSAINSANKKIADFESEREEFSAKQSSGLFVNDEDKQNAIDELNKKQEAAEQAIKDIETKKKSAPNNPIIAKLIDRVEKTYKEQVQFLPKTTETIDNNNTAETTDPRNNEWRASKLSPYGYNRKEIKLISKIFGIIISVTDKENAEYIISKIEDGLQGKKS